MKAMQKVRLTLTVFYRENNNKQIEIYKAELKACHLKETAVPDKKPDLLNLLEGKENLTDLIKEVVR